MASKRALISVYNKEGLVHLGQALSAQGFELVSTGGTARALATAGLPVTLVEQVTESPEILDGRVKTLHPRIHGGILARRDLATHMDTLFSQQISPFDLVVVNLYPFAETTENPDCSLDDALEMIDIGGPAMLRAAAKNFPWVLPVCDPSDYPQLLTELAHDVGASNDFRRNLAARAFAHTAAYDAAVSRWLSGEQFPEILTLALERRQILRYGENPHQQAALYSSPDQPGALAATSSLQGKGLSYNNLNDANAALALVSDFTEPVAAAIKHAVPCGVGIGASPAQAFQRAWDADPVSIFGGIVSLNRLVDRETAALMLEIFLEVIIAPGFSPEALELLASKKNLRLLACPLSTARGMKLCSIDGGVLVQEGDSGQSETELSDDGRLAWLTAKHAKSNAIVVARDGMTLGIGSGAVSRIAAARAALAAAGQGARGAVLASDGFIPFVDVVELAAAFGIRTIIQPGGSKGDSQVLAAAKLAGIEMVLTGIRHFRH